MIGWPVVVHLKTPQINLKINIGNFRMAKTLGFQVEKLSEQEKNALDFVNKNKQKIVRALSGRKSTPTIKTKQET